jgi:hypothetical protein
LKLPRALALLGLACCLPQDVTFAQPDASTGRDGGGGDAGSPDGGRGGGGSGGECGADRGGAAGACQGGGGRPGCDRAGDCRACLACSTRSTCNTEQEACDTEPDCVALDACLTACGPDEPNCFFDCHGMHPTGSPLWGDAINCVFCECSVRGLAAPCDQDAAMFCG